MAPKAELKHIPLAEIRENPVALRAVNRQSEEFGFIKDSIGSVGVLNAINVRFKEEGKGSVKDGKKYEIIDGLHRYTACLELGLADIPAQILTMDDAEALAAQIIGNFHSVATKPVEYTKGMMRILSLNPLMTLTDLARQLSVSPQFIDQRLSLNKLDDKIGALVDSNQINLANAFSLAKLPVEEQRDWVERAMTQGSGEFGPAVNARVKQIREAKRQGRAAAPEEFVPVAKIRPMAELKAQFEAAEKGEVVLSTMSLLNKEGASTALEGFNLAIAWVLNMTADDKAEAKTRWEERKKREADAKLARDAERKEQRSKEAQEKQAQLIKEADEARAKAVAAGVDLTAKKNGDGKEELEAAAIGAGLTDSRMGEPMVTV